MPRKSSVRIVTTIGIDMGKTTLHMVGLDSCGAIVLREKVSRGRIARFPSLCRSLNLRPPPPASQGQIFGRAIRSGSHASPTKPGSLSTTGRAAFSSLVMLPISMRQWVARA